LMVAFRQRFIPVGRFNRPGKKMKPMWITIHNTGNSRAGAGALNHALWLESYPKPENPANIVSYHYTVDDRYIIQHLPWNETAQHTGTKVGNEGSIGIEICENIDCDLYVAEDNAARLVADLLKETGIPSDRVVPHKFWSGKNCPRLLLPRWEDWIMRVKRYSGR
jgi:N-acetylmuramoyl-L-alanine amidase